MELDMATISYALLTTGICFWAFARGSHGVSWIGVVTFLGWVFYTVVARITTFSAEQAWLSVGDAVQAISIFYLIKRYHLGAIPMVAMGAAFISMIGLHISLFNPHEHGNIRYHEALNTAYLIQLSVLLFMVMRDEYRRFRSSHGSNPKRNNHNFGGGAFR